MPTATVEALVAPLRRVQALVGPGFPADPAAGPAATLNGIRTMLLDVSGAAGQAWQRAGSEWSGSAADAASDFASTTAAAIDEAAERAGGLGGVAADAAHAVAGAHRRLQDLVDDFESTAVALEPRLDEPGVAKELLAAARDALARAIAIVEELCGELDGHATALEGRAPPASAAPTSPAGYGAGAGIGSGSPMGPPAGGVGSSGLGGMGAGSPIPAELASFTRPDGTEVPDAAEFGDGVAIQLPDGSVVMAPNAVAASAVRHALTQLGVPYQWGGTTPGVGLDCSGLTQWAYGEAGLNIPRLAQEQDIGGAVASGSLLPGDLAVWDGHVAMVVGNGLMVEAGDPVKLSPIRTANAGQGFQGFWRPTA